MAGRYTIQLNLVRITGRRHASVLRSTMEPPPDCLFSARLLLNEEWGVFINANQPVTEALQQTIQENLSTVFASMDTQG
ncbi:MAG: hypothetical protein PHP44_09735 [Kiritimatiellae bacterium]|nr:hypothetical protein [Kiritimatiellia bacterium]